MLHLKQVHLAELESPKYCPNIYVFNFANQFKYKKTTTKNWVLQNVFCGQKVKNIIKCIMFIYQAWTYFYGERLLLQLDWLFKTRWLCMTAR